MCSSSSAPTRSRPVRRAGHRRSSRTARPPQPHALQPLRARQGLRAGLRRAARLSLSSRFTADRAVRRSWPALLPWRRQSCHFAKWQCHYGSFRLRSSKLISLLRDIVSDARMLDSTPARRSQSRSLPSMRCICGIIGERPSLICRGLRTTRRSRTCPSIRPRRGPGGPAGAGSPRPSGN